jgi:hypothetical protein
LRPCVLLQPVCKPGSVWFHHLSCHVITGVIIRPTPRHRTSSPLRRYTWSFNPSGVRLPALPQEPVSSYLAFSPLSAEALAKVDLALAYDRTVIFCYTTIPSRIRKHGALCCPDFPSPLQLSLSRNDGTTGCTAKLKKYG